jgi:hypothetical protein
MLRVFIGTDPRQPIAWNVLSDSINRHSSKPVAITPLSLKTLPITRRGLTEFTFSRFLPPYLCGYKGTALFLDADMVGTADIAELFAQANGVDSVQVNRDQARFEWPSAMLFNCEHCTTLTPEYVQDARNQLFDFAWAKSIGEFSPEWTRRQAVSLHEGYPCVARDSRQRGGCSVPRCDETHDVHLLTR